MTTQDTAATEEETSGKSMRRELEAQIAENKQLKADARNNAFSQAGLDTSRGLGKAIFQVYDGPATQEAILEFAQTEYEHVPSIDNAPPPHPQAAQIALGQHQLDQVGQVAGSVTQTTRNQRLAAARQAGDMAAEGAIMSAQMQDMMDAQRPQTQ